MGVLERLLEEVRKGNVPSQRDLENAFREIRERYLEVSGIALREENRGLMMEFLKMGILMGDQDLFMACEEHDSLRELAYLAVKSLSGEELEEASRSVLANDLEGTLLGAYILRRSGRGGGT